MMTVKEFNSGGDDLERMLHLSSSPIAIRFIEKESDIPGSALRPKKQRNYHLAQCQAYALSRRDKITVAMLKEDNWCLAPLIVYGHRRKNDEMLHNAPDYDCLELGKYIGVLSAPLNSAEFQPDVLNIYCDTTQLRHMLLALRKSERPNVGAGYFPPSCSYAVVTPVLTGKFMMVLPDPGEYARALTPVGEMIFAVPQTKLGTLLEDIKVYQKTSIFAHETVMIRPDFPQLENYKRAFKTWDMDYEK
jgi:uncharacterized protein (DUF169 family)